MLKFWIRLTVSTNWRHSTEGDRFVMRRRVGDQVEVRDCTADELAEAAYWSATR